MSFLKRLAEKPWLLKTAKVVAAIDALLWFFLPAWGVWFWLLTAVNLLFVFCLHEVTRNKSDSASKSANGTES